MRVKTETYVVGKVCKVLICRKIVPTFGDEVWEFFDFLFPMLLLLLLLTVFVRNFFFHVGSHNIILLHDDEKHNSERIKQSVFLTGIKHSRNFVRSQNQQLISFNLRLFRDSCWRWHSLITKNNFVITQDVVSAKSVTHKLIIKILEKK